MSTVVINSIESESAQPVAPTAESVAKIIEALATIGAARNALLAQGWSATIVANRITVNQEICAQYVCANGFCWWQVYAYDGTPPMWTVGARDDSAASWAGAE